MVMSRRMRPEQAAARSAPPKKTEARGTGHVGTRVSDRQGIYHEDNREIQVLEEVFSEENPPAYIKVGAGLTLNLGNFESLRVDCSISIPCDRKKINDAYQFASEFVADRIAEEQTNWLGDKNQKVKGR